MLNKVYLDLGCHDGITIDEFYMGEFFKIDPTGIPSIGIDPLDRYHEQKRKLTERYGTKFIRGVVSTYDGKAEVLEGTNDISTTITKEKSIVHQDKRYTVKCIDLDKFVQDYGEIYCRMDIEAAEYDILEKMIKTGSIKKFKFLAIEFHTYRLNDEYVKDFKIREDAIWKALDNLGIKTGKA